MTEIDVEVRNRVGVITLNAPERRNALTVAMAHDLVAACDRLDDDPGVGAVVLRGEGGWFCAGADRAMLESVYVDPAGEQAFNDLTAIYRSFARVSELQVASIAAVRGGAVGAGMNLMLAASARIVADDAGMFSGFSGLGLHPGGGHLALLHRLVGFEATVAIAVLNQPVPGARAVELGMAWEALPDAEVDSRAESLARGAAEHPELSRMIMASLRHEVGPPAISLAAALELERASQMRTQRKKGESTDQPLGD